MAILNALDSWYEALDKGEVVGALLVDVSRAFDTVPYQKLISELLAIGYSLSSLKWFESYLDNRRQRVVHQHTITEWKEVGRGVPQGSCLSSLLFNIYVRELPQQGDSEAIQFADDLTNSASDKNPTIVNSQSA